jgi:S-formylglutathione hydrolase FrmB
MRHFRTILLCALFASPGFLVTAGEELTISSGQADPAGFLVHTVRSSYQAGETRIRVLLPNPLKPAGRYVVLYVLPVEAGDGVIYKDGLLEAQKSNLHNQYQLICVAPTFADLPWYADHPTNGKIRQESYFLQGIVPFIDRTYPTLACREGRLLVGFSKSGCGAFSLLLRNPHVFGKAAAWDAPLMLEKPNYGGGTIYGTQENFANYQISALLRQHAAQLQDEVRLVHFGYGNFREHHQAAHRLMDELKIPHQYRDGPKRTHDWASGWLPEAVQMLSSSGK